MTVDALLTEFERAGIRLWVEGGELRFRAPRGALTDALRDAVRAHKAEVIERLAHDEAKADDAAVAADPDRRFDPAPVTDVQAAYLMGRSESYAFGGVGCHGYAELRFDELDAARLDAAWQRLLARHDALRTVFDSAGTQRVLPTVPPWSIRVVDASADADGGEGAVAQAREAMSHRVYDPSSWPLFDLQVTQRPDHAVLHLSFDLLVADFVSLAILLDELRTLYEDPSCELPAPGITFRDYVLADRAARQGPAFDLDRQWWEARLDDFPGPPDLPLAIGADSGGRGRFARLQHTIDAPAWQALREAAGREQVTPTGIVLAAFTQVVRRWSRQRRFAIDVTLLNRMPVHPGVGRLVGDFTAVDVLAVDHDGQAPFADRARAVQARLWEDLDHRLFLGIDVIRELARRRGPENALFPVVFTSAIGAADPAAVSGSAGGPWDLGRAVYAITQTPQVFLDCQVTETGGGLTLTWDHRLGVFPDGVVEEMFDAFTGLITRLAEGVGWHESRVVPLLPRQAAERAAVNDTAGPLPDALLHEGFLAQALRTPDQPVVITSARTLTFRDVVEHASGIASRLRAEGAQPGDRVAVAMDKGWEQVVAVLGILMAGAAYLPIDTSQPALRRDQILTDARVPAVLTSAAAEALWPDGVTAIDVSRVAPAPMSAMPSWPADPDDVAYVIYTSGSTGVPKGVAITHRAAWNTIEDVNHRFEVGPADRVLGVAGLGFDLSVYDVFGVPAVGGALVLPDAGRRNDPSHWAELVAAHRVTVWNSVPAQMQMLADYLDLLRRITPAADQPALRLVMLSGDWIPVDLPAQVRKLMPDVRLISMGGATEAAIWSIFHDIVEVRPDWPSIPYGKPLANQDFHVLDDDFDDCPEWVVGELYIGGAGLAVGYLGDEIRTKERFITHPRTGRRLYRTGDLGRYRPGGDIEFLGREDNQVKIRGHRIELAEVEAALLDHPSVRRAVAVVTGDQPLERQLVAVVEQDPSAPPVDTEVLLVHAGARLPGYMLPARVIVDEVPLTANGKVDRGELRRRAAVDSRPARAADDEPRDDLERALADVWRQTLNVERVGREQNFFELGGDSLQAAKVAGDLLGVVPEVEALLFDEVLVHMLEVRTVAGLAARLREARSAPTTALATAAAEAPRLIPLGGPADGPLVIVVHHGPGAPDAGAAATASVVEGARLVGMPAGPAPDAVAVERLAAEHAVAVSGEAGGAPVRVVGSGLAAWTAFELARQLAESGAAVDGLHLVDPFAADDRWIAAFEAAAPTPYVGDIEVVASDPEARAVAVWREVCLGEVAVSA